MTGPRRVVGVDFSGARDAGRKIWIASGSLRNGGVEIEKCFPARNLPNAGCAREAALPALVEYIAGETDATFGLDFPFGLPASLVPEATWEEFVVGFDRRFATAKAFREACRAIAGGAERKRRTDEEARAPFCAYNLRLHKQTFEGIGSVLLPLVRDARATITPFQPPRPGLPAVAEICPASLLKTERLYRPYKGRASERGRGRLAILRESTRRGLLREPTEDLRSLFVEDPGGDALDAALAAIGAARAIRDPTSAAPRDGQEAIEGRVFY